MPAAGVRRSRPAGAASSSRRTSCTARSPGSPARRSSWPSGRPTSRSTRPSPGGLIERAAAGDRLPVLAEQPDRPGGAAGRSSREVVEAAPGLVVVDEAYGQFVAALGARAAGGAGSRQPRAGDRADVLEDVGDGGVAARLRDRRSGGDRRLRGGRAAVPPVGADAGVRHCRPRATGRRWRRGWPWWPRSGAGWRPRWPICRSTAGRRTPTSSSSGRAGSRPRRSGRRCSTAASSSGTAPAGTSLEGCLRVTVGTPKENDRFLRALEEALDDRRPAAEGDAPAGDEGDDDRGRPSTSTAPGGVGLDGPAVLRPHGRAARPPRRLRPVRRGDGRPARRRAPHGRGRRHRRRAVPGRGARRQGRRATVRVVVAAARRGAGRRGPRPVRPAVPGVRRAVRAGHAPASARRRSTRSWRRSSGGPSRPRPR